MGMMSEEMTTWGEGGCQNSVVLVVRVTRKNKNYFFCVPFLERLPQSLGKNRSWPDLMPFSNLISFLPVSTHFLHMEVCSHVVAHS
jgi:hypothetical protein